MLPNIKTFWVFFFPCMPKFPCRPPFCSENVGYTVEFETAVNQSWSPGHRESLDRVTEWPSYMEPATGLHLGATGTVKFHFGNRQWTRMLSIVSVANTRARSLSHEQPWEGAVFLELGAILCFPLKEKIKVTFASQSSTVPTSEIVRVAKTVRAALKWF